MKVAADIRAPWRIPLLLLAIASLFLGVATGLARLGWSLPGADLAPIHGPLMVSGFFGTVISLERAVALRWRWAYAAPLFSGVATLTSIVAATVVMSAALAVAGSVVMLAASAVVYGRQRELFTLTLMLGAASWMIGNLLWLGGQPVYAVVPWWIAFLVLTIAGERLELSRLLPRSAVANGVFSALVVTLLGGVAVSLLARSAGTIALGAALIGIALWLMRQDVARRTVKVRGLPRFVAICLLSGYAWLAVSGTSMLLTGGLGQGGFAYDAALHAVLLGFVFSMVFGHAPIIFPAVLRVGIRYSPYFYAPLALLHASLCVRLLGDWMGSSDWRAWGGALNGVALLTFVLVTVGAVIRGAIGPGAKALHEG